MKYKFFAASLLFIVFSCKGQKVSRSELYYDENNYISLDLSFIKDVKSKISESQKHYLIKERESIVNREIDNENYLKVLNNRIIDIDIFSVNTFYETFLKGVISKLKKNINIKSIYFINTGYNAEIYQWESTILIENFDGNIQLFNNDGKKIEYLNSDLIDFTNDFMRTYVYSGKKTLLISGYFTIDKIIANGINKYEVTSIVAPEMQFYQLEILKKFYKLGQD